MFIPSYGVNKNRVVITDQGSTAIFQCAVCVFNYKQIDVESPDYMSFQLTACCGPTPQRFLEMLRTGCSC